MLTKPIALAGLAIAVILAAGAGAYFAVRQNAAPMHLGDTAANTGSMAPAPTTVATDGLAVEATEAIVEDRAPAVTEPASPPTRTETTPTVAKPATAPLPARPSPDPVPAQPVPSPEPGLERDATSASSSSASSPGAGPSVADGALAPTRAPVTAIEPDGPRGPLEAEEASTIGAETEAGQRSPETTGADLPAVEGWSRVDGGAPADPSVAAPLRAEPLVGLNRPEMTADRPVLDLAPVLVEYEIAADSVIGLQVETGVSTRTAEVEDSVEARVTRDVLVADQVAVPAGTRMLGSVVLVEQGGKLRGASRLGVRFHTLVMEDGPRTRLVTETIYREGAPQGRDTVAKVGGAAVGGAILGAIFGGARGAAIGGSIGAAGGTAAAAKGEAEPAGLPPGTMLTVRLSRPAVVAVEQ